MWTFIRSFASSPLPFPGDVDRSVLAMLAGMITKGKMNMSGRRAAVASKSRKFWRKRFDRVVSSVKPSRTDTFFSPTQEGLMYGNHQQDAAMLAEPSVVREARYRCRLIKKREVIDDNILGAFTEVWDTSAEPIEYGLPRGVVEFEIETDSREKTRAHVDRYRQEHDIYTAGLWNARGSF